MMKEFSFWGKLSLKAMVSISYVECYFNKFMLLFHLFIVIVWKIIGTLNVYFCVALNI